MAKISNLARLGAVLTLVEPGGIDEVLRSLLDVHVMRRKFRDVKETGTAYAQQIMASPSYSAGVHGSTAEAVAGWALNRFSESLSPERKDI